MREGSDIEKLMTSRGELEFTLLQMPGRQAGKLIIRLAKAHGPAIGQLAAAFKDPSKVGDAIGSLTQGLDEQEFETLLSLLTKGGKVNLGEEFADLDPKLLDDLFRGQAAGLFKLVWLGLRLNYTDFFAEFTALMPRAVIPSKSAAAGASR